MSDAFTLIFETSTPEASLALVGPDGVVDQRGFRSDRNHNALLFEPLRDLLHSSAKPKIGLVLVGSGPGSYSGTRVGIAAAQGVAIACACPAVALPSILAVPPAENGARCLAIGDARRGSYWTARIDANQLASGPALCDAAGLESALAAATSEHWPVFTFEDPSRFPLSSTDIRLAYPDATRLWHAWQAAGQSTRNIWSAAIPQPLYLKPPHITKGKRPSLLKP